MKKSVIFFGGALVLLLCLPGPLLSQTIIDEWNTVAAPPAPELKTVTISPATTALLLLDFNSQTCNEKTRPRCVRSIPAMAAFLAKAREKCMTVIYSLSPGASVADIAKELTPAAGEPVVTSGPDKFLGTDLEKIIKEKGIKTVIVAGTAAHGAVLYTASGAALRGVKVLVAVDGVSAETLYAEQYTAWHLLTAPRVSAQVTLTRTALISF
ncbi:MAG: cysteine hydrolase [Deltaproteobacteria bacterium]|nr:cysteine hydrolase [Deltaproteobacteria bacterium]